MTAGRLRAPVAAGALYGVALYVLNVEAVARRWWPEIRRHGGRVQVADHVAFGAVLAVASARGKPSR